MKKDMYLLAKIAACTGVFVSFAFAGIGTSPIIPLWKFIIMIFGG